MYISRVVVQNFRNLKALDIRVSDGVTAIIGENNAGKSNLIYAIRLAIDANLSSTFRQLTLDDFTAGIDISTPQQVLVAVEFSGFAGHVNEQALLYGYEIGDTARIIFRFRPKPDVRQAIIGGEHSGKGLELDDYRWEIRGGCEKDPAALEWHENVGTWVKFEELQQAYLVVFMEPLRDVEQRLRQTRTSPLTRLVESMEIPDAEKAVLVKQLSTANDNISNSTTIKGIGTGITDAFKTSAGTVYGMAVRLGLAPPNFNDISRSLNLLMTDAAMVDMSPAQNGLGLNNVLYISMLLEYFQRRAVAGKSAGNLLLIEEPEAHLHPQLQRVLLEALRKQGFQAIVTTHSTHISSATPLDATVVITPGAKGIVSSVSFAIHPTLGGGDKADLARYLDATRGSLLYAKKVMLVEGPAELFLIPPLVKKVLGIDLDEQGISVVPIHGVHFPIYMKLFGPQAIQKKCAVVADADMTPSDAGGAGVEIDEGQTCSKDDLEPFRNDYAQVFLCPVTFEREITGYGTLVTLSKAALEVGAKKLSAELAALKTAHEKKSKKPEELDDELNRMKEKVLALASRVGKARFAQVASKHVEDAQFVPKYIKDAVEWLMKPLA